MTLRFSQKIFHSDQYGYAKRARAFRTQIDLNKKIIADQFGFGKHDSVLEKTHHLVVWCDNVEFEMCNR
jgi:hypothetical protein